MTDNSPVAHIERRVASRLFCLRQTGNDTLTVNDFGGVGNVRLADGGSSRLGEIRAGWPALSACFLGHMVGVHALPPYTLGLFINPLQTEFGWSRTQISFGVTVLGLALAVAVPLAGAFADKYGERILIAVSMVAMALVYVALSLMGPSLPVYWSLMALLGILGCGCSTVTLSRVVVSIFDRLRGTALGITLIGTGLMGTLFPLILGPVIAGYGWRGGYLAIATIVAGLMPVMAGLLLLNRAGGRPMTPAAATVRQPERVMSIREAIRQPLFVHLLAAFLCIALATGGVIIHFVPMLIDSGLPPANAAKIASLLGISLICGRLLTGIAVDRFFAPRIAMVIMAVSSAGFALLTFGGPSLVPLAGVIVGISFGAEIDLVVYLVSRYFQTAIYGRIFGLLYGAVLFALGIAPLLYGAVRDAAGNYEWAFVMSAVLLAISAVLFGLLPKFAVSVGTADTQQDALRDCR